MGIEIEVKAWVDEPEALKSRINGAARFIGAFEKTDAYWYPASGRGLPFSGVRVRNERGGDGGWTTRITYKTKEQRGLLEVNHEREFTVSDGAVFEELLAGLKLCPLKHKRKTGWAWTYESDLTVELALVEGLGFFIELEILAENDAAETVGAARERLLGLLDLLGIARERIESRYYTELLGQKRGRRALAAG
jgi:adenylate cyclase class 2